MGVDEGWWYTIAIFCKRYKVVKVEVHSDDVTESIPFEEIVEIEREAHLQTQNWIIKKCRAAGIPPEDIKLFKNECELDEDADETFYRDHWPGYNCVKLGDPRPDLR